MRTAHLIVLMTGLAAILVAGVVNSIDILENVRPSEGHWRGLLASIPGVACLYGWAFSRRASSLQFTLSTWVTIGSVLIGFSAVSEWLSSKDFYETSLFGEICFLVVMLPCGLLSVFLSLAVQTREGLTTQDRDGEP